MLKGRVLFSLFLIAVAAYAVHAALGWKFKAALFPLSVSIPLIMLAGTQLLLDLFGGTERAKNLALDMELADNVAPAEARRRATAVFLWVAGFIVLVYLVSFPIAVPVFFFAYLKLQSSIGWLHSTTVTAATWGFFYLLFQRLLHLPFESGVIQSWLGL
jgi:hypothetical protein